LLNRGDKYFIAINEDKPLDNPFSGVVVDLCPVGALTHRNWRFNTRIWYANPKDAVCPGCSTGCSVKVFERDGQVVQVKARYNKDVNKEWLCDEGRYGYPRFCPEERITTPLMSGQQIDFENIKAELQNLKKGKALILLSPDLYLEEYAIAAGFKQKVLPDADMVVAVRCRELTDLENILISPDYAPNFMAAVFAGVISIAANSEIDFKNQENARKSAESFYDKAISQIKAGAYDSLIIIGEGAIATQDLADLSLLEAISNTPFSIGILSDREGALSSLCKINLPGRTVLEKSGLSINRLRRLQYSEQVLDFPEGTAQSWRWLGMISEKLGFSVVTARSDRDLTLSYLGSEARLKGLTIRKIKGDPISGIGVDLGKYTPTANDNNVNIQGSNFTAG
jgi:NADH dehydrogenase/NADH:ubiquinone oxidoreductase subunit G